MSLSLSDAQDELDKALNGSRAVVDGVITRCFVDKGAYVEKGTAIFEMQTDECYKVRMLVSRHDIATVRTGQKARITVEGKKYSGTVDRISRAAEDDDSGKAKASVDIIINTDDELIIGLEADVTLDIGTVINVVTVPTDSIYTDDFGDYVFVIENEQLTRRYVTTGAKGNELTEIKLGIWEGESIAVDGRAEQYEGKKVRME